MVAITAAAAAAAAAIYIMWGLTGWSSPCSDIANCGGFRPQVERFLHSNRLQEDLHVAAERLREQEQDRQSGGGGGGCGGSGGSTFVFNLVVRELGQFNPRNEIRGFVYSRQLTALTQYNQLVYFPQALLEREMVVDKVSEFMEELIPALAADPSSSTLEHFVVDLVVLDDGRVVIIELNPFAEFAGSGLFAWYHHP